MNDEPRFNSLTDDDLEQVAGGMTCAQGIAAAKICLAVGDFIESMSGSGAYLYGMGEGYLGGACK